MLQIKDLMVFFENGLALNDFSMEVSEGEIVGVIGSNSAGKTTLMNTISGLIIDMKIKEQRKGGERITIYGEIIFQGKDITDTHPSHRVKMGLVLARERHPIFPESDVAENLKIAGHQTKKSEIKEMTQYVFALFPALSQLRRRKAGFLSGGGTADAVHRNDPYCQTDPSSSGRTPAGTKPHDADHTGKSNPEPEEGVWHNHLHDRTVCPAHTSYDR